MAKRIISCSRRTDIPAFYYDWLQGVLENKEIEVPNVKFPEKKYKYDLSPEEIRCIVLWSKNFRNVVENPGYLDDYNLVFNYTITGYNKLLEPNVSTYNESIKIVEKLSNKYNPEQIRPRFDPVILTSNGEVYPTPDKPGKARLNQFDILCRDLSLLGINNVTYSFVDLYPHVKRRLAMNDIQYLNLNDNLKVKFSQRMVEIADKHGIQIYSCSTPLLESVEGVKKAHCIDAGLIQELFPEKDKVSHTKDSGQRKECGCAKSTDIGGYLPCKHSCVYCYGITT